MGLTRGHQEFRGFASGGHHDFTVLTGEGSYEGLSVMLWMQPGGPFYELTSVIIPGGLPEPPEWVLPPGEPLGSGAPTPLKFMLASVIVALFGSLVLAGILTTQQRDDMAPAAVTESPSPMRLDQAAVMVTGR